MVCKNFMILCFLFLFCTIFLSAQHHIPAVHVSIYDTEDPVMMGKETMYVIEARNEGSAPCTNVRFQIKTSKELEFVSADGAKFNIQNESIDFDAIPIIQPGEKAGLTVLCKVQRAGFAKLTVFLIYDQVDQVVVFEEPTTTYSVFVEDGDKPMLPALHINVYDTEDPVDIGNETCYVVEIRNEGTALCEGLKARCLISDKMQFIASVPESQLENGVIIFKPTPVLEPGAIASYRVRCKAIKEGFSKFGLISRYEEFEKDVLHEEGTTIFKASEAKAPQVKNPKIPQGIAAMHISAYDTEDPVELGKETIYIVEARNEGTMACTHVILRGEIPSGLEFVSADGPVPYKFQSGFVTYEPVPALNPGEKSVYKIKCKAIKEGSFKLIATIRYREFNREIAIEETTNLYK